MTGSQVDLLRGALTARCWPGQIVSLQGQQFLARVPERLRPDPGRCALTIDQSTDAVTGTVTPALSHAGGEPRR